MSESGFSRRAAGTGRRHHLRQVLEYLLSAGPAYKCYLRNILETGEGFVVSAAIDESFDVWLPQWSTLVMGG